MKSAFFMPALIVVLVFMGPPDVGLCVGPRIGQELYLMKSAFFMPALIVVLVFMGPPVGCGAAL